MIKINTNINDFFKIKNLLHGAQEQSMVATS